MLVDTHCMGQKRKEKRNLLRKEGKISFASRKPYVEYMWVHAIQDHLAATLTRLASSGFSENKGLDGVLSLAGS